MLLYQQKREDSDEILKDFTIFATEITRKIIAMDRENKFEEFLEKCKKENQICGAGNPYAHILLVGQEHYAEKPITNDTEWKEYLDKNYDYCSITNNPWVKKDENDNRWRNCQNPSKTWCYYQQLINKALPKRLNRSGKQIQDFEFDAFTTELNNEAKPSSRVNGKEERKQLRERIEARLKVFEESDFIKNFPVIVLACGDYVTNSVERGVTQINDTFGVEFDGELKGRHKSEKGKLWFTTHHSKDKQRLVIHTRQFSLRYTNKEDREWLVNEMSKVIKEHLDHLEKLGLL